MPPAIDATERLVSKAPRPLLHLLRTRDLEEANDAEIHVRNGRSIRELGEEQVLAAIRSCG